MSYPASVSYPLSHATPSDRVLYLKRVLLLTFLGLVVSALTGVVSAMIVATVPMLQTRWGLLAFVLGSFAVAQYVAPRFVFGGQRWFGFGLGSVFQGLAMGPLLLAAATLGLQLQGSAFLLIGQAMMLVAATGVGMTFYLWSNPREFSMLRAGISGLMLPMLILMGISFVYPVGGVLGIAMSGLFVLVSAAGLLYQINQVLHRLRTDMHVEGAYLITMGVLVLFWNILTLLMRLNRR